MNQNLQTDKFMENSLSIRRFFPLHAKNTTMLNLLALMLQGRSEHLPTREAWAKASSHAYGLQSGWGVFGYGNDMMVEFRAKWLRSAFIPDKHYISEVASLIDEALFHPLLNEENLAEAKYLLKNRITLQRQDPDARALLEAMAIAQENHTISVPLIGDAALIDDISLDEIQQFWKTLSQTPAAILYGGPAEQEIKDTVEQFISNEPVSNSYTLLQAQPFRQTVLEKDISQCSLVQIYATGIAWDSPESLKLQLFNMLLGASSTSLLFEEIREKHSYCYSISSMVIKLDGALVISTAAHRDHLDDVIRLIGEILGQIKTKSYDPQALVLAKNDLLDGLAGQQDSLQSMVEQQFMNDLRKWPYSMEDSMEIIENTTADELAKIAAQLVLLCQAEVLQKASPAAESEEADTLEEVQTEDGKENLA